MQTRLAHDDRESESLQVGPSPRRLLSNFLLCASVQPENAQTTIQKLQRMLDAVEGNLTRALVKHRELESAAVWDKSLQLAVKACSPRPNLFARVVLRCYTEGGARRGDARLLDEVAGLFIEGLVVHGSPLGSLPPLDSWPAPCLLTWEVDGSEYTPPRPDQGLAPYLCSINDERYTLKQQNACMRRLKPVSADCDQSAKPVRSVECTLASCEGSMQSRAVGDLLQSESQQKFG